MFKKATRKKLKARIAIDGPSGAGKTYTALRFAFALAGPTGRVAVIDTEHRSASKYEGESPDGVPFAFDVAELSYYEPNTYIQTIKESDRQGYDVLVVDSLSHAWDGVGGALDKVDKAAEKSGNSFTAWRDVTPQHRQLVESILACRSHIICTMRSKMEYVLEETVNKAGKKVMTPRKVGMAPIQRQGVEYEFDVVADMDVDHCLAISKTRCPALDGAKATKPDANFLAPLVRWLGEGIEEEAAATEVAVPPPPPAVATVATTVPAKPAKVKLSAKASGQSASTSDPCGDTMADRIKELAKAANVAPARLREILAEQHVDKLANLPQSVAADVIRNLEVKAQDATAPF